MSGVEVAAGLVLGVLPLLIAAAEHYEDMIRPFQRARNYTQEVRKFQKILEAQKTIFRNECQHLLASITDWGLATRILQERIHPFSTDRNLDEKFARQLGHSGDACAALIALIEDRLKDVDRESEGFTSVISDSQKPDSFSAQEWRRCLGKKLKFSLSKSSLDNSVAQLRDLNRDFVTLCSQLVRIKDGNKPTRKGSDRSLDADREITYFRAIQKASEQVYNALGKACTVHTTHSAQLCLQAKRITSNQTQIRFDMAFNHLALSDSAMSGDPIWLAIESISTESLASGSSTALPNPPRRPLGNALSQLTGTLKRQEELPSFLNTKKLKVTRSVTSTARAPSRNSVVASEQRSPSESIGILDRRIPDLYTRRNFCLQVRKCSDQFRKDRDVCIGVLERTSNCHHVVYLAGPSTADCVKEIISLEHLISLTSKTDQVGSLPQYEKLRLAKLLSVGVLQFHETPWLSSGRWRSQDVVFFTPGGIGPLQKPALMTPYLNVPVTSAQNREATSSGKGCLAPNALLHSLGVILLELAYEGPLHSLQEPCDLQGGEESRYTEFFAARRLSKSLGSVLGSTYGQIVRKCLNCDFGCGDDLSEPALQVEFYRDVICELQRLEEGFRKLQLGP